MLLDRQPDFAHLYQSSDFFLMEGRTMSKNDIKPKLNLFAYKINKKHDCDDMIIKIKVIENTE